MGDSKDALVRAVRPRLPLPPLFISPNTFPASFGVNDRGAIEDGSFVVDAITYDWSSIACIWVRPGHSWSSSACLASSVDALSYHEIRAAWCTLLDAYQGLVVDRLSPEWFLDPALHRAKLADSFAATMDQPQYGVSVRIDRCTSHAAIAYLLCGEVVAGGGSACESVDWAIWLSKRLREVRCWQEHTKVRVARVDAYRTGNQWAVATVDPVPSLTRVRAEAICAGCGSLSSLFV